MLQSRLVSVQNEVCALFCTGLGPRGGGVIPYKSYMGRRPPGRVFGPLPRKRGNRLQKKLPFFQKQDPKFGINSGKNLPYNHINRYFFQHIFRHKQDHELSGTLYPNLG